MAAMAASSPISRNVGAIAVRSMSAASWNSRPHRHEPLGAPVLQRGDEEPGERGDRTDKDDDGASGLDDSEQQVHRVGQEVFRNEILSGGPVPQRRTPALDWPGRPMDGGWTAGR